jgi:hypothetical protein
VSSDPEASWSYSELGPGATRQGDIPTKHALDESTKTFVREVLQNANDAGLEDECVEVIFDFEVLSGAELAEFKRTLHWEELVETHLYPAGEESSDLGIEQYLEHVEDRGELLLLTVEDRSTTGLTGTETADNSNYTALVRDILRSYKDEDTAGGSHGVGKTVLWAFSGVSTVLFNSVPVEDDETPDEAPPRLIGRSILPDHVGPDDVLYRGNGWFGTPDDTDEIERNVSVWGRDAVELAERLHVDRQLISGTSATVVGFRDPSGEFGVDTDVETLVEEFEETAVRWFWPAMLDDELAVYLSGPEDSIPREVDPWDLDEVRPFVESYTDTTVRGHHVPDHVEKLESPGDVARHDLAWSIPDRSDGTPTADGEVSLLARTRTPADGDERVDQVAVFRRPRMVVEYLDKSEVSRYGTSFYAVLVCGEARNSLGVDIGEGDRDIDEFLRAAEPAAHDEWKDYKNPRLRSQYERGWGTALKRLKGELLEGALDDLVGEEDKGDVEELDELSDLMPRTSVGGGSSTGPGDRAFRWKEGPFVQFVDGRWSFEGEVKAGSVDHDGWTGRLELTRRGDEGTSAGELDVVGLEVDGADGVVEDGTGRIDASAGAGLVAFEGHSVELDALDPYSGEYGRVELQFVGDVTTRGDET